MTEDGTDTTGSAFVRVLRGLLRPLVRAMIAQGITAPALYRVLKRIYVEVAESDFQLEGERQTDSRISMLTGVHRRDVRSFRETDYSAETAAQEKMTTIASVLGRWLANPDYRDAAGKPRPLPRTATEGASFDALVSSISKDIRPRTVLDELTRQGLAEIQDGLVVLKAETFLGPSDPDQKVYFFAENVGDHIAAAVDNLLSDTPRFMERAVFYNRLTEESVAEIEQEARRLGEEVLLELNEQGHQRQVQDVDSSEGTHRFRFGVFFYREDEADGADKNKAGDNEDL